jgi:hypothetical protein
MIMERVKDNFINWMADATFKFKIEEHQFLMVEIKNRKILNIKLKTYICGCSEYQTLVENDTWIGNIIYLEDAKEAIKTLKNENYVDEITLNIPVYTKVAI